jgi:hypothetical protein
VLQPARMLPRSSNNMLNRTLHNIHTVSIIAHQIFGAAVNAACRPTLGCSASR